MSKDEIEKKSIYKKKTKVKLGSSSKPVTQQNP